MNSEEVLSVLIQLSKADNYFDQFELSYLLKVGRHLGVDDEKVEHMMNSPEKTQLTVPASEEARMSIIYYLLFLMKIDTIISDEEVELVHHYGFKLGFPAKMIDEFISLMDKSKYSKVNTADMLSILRKYQN